MLSIFFLLLGMLDAVEIRPNHQNLSSWQGSCNARFEVVIPAHADNRRVTITVADAGGIREEAEWPVEPGRFALYERFVQAGEDERLVLTARLYGPFVGDIRASAVGVVRCV